MEKICICNPNSRHAYQLCAAGYATDFVWCGIGEDYAYGEIFVKVLHYGKYPQSRQREAWKNAFREAELMERVCSCTRKVPKLYDHWDDSTQKCYVLVMQKMPGQTLRQWMQKRTISQYDDKSIRLRSLILLQLTEILLDIHRKIPSHGHLDLKPENVMIWLDEQKKWQVGLIDFGTAALNHSVKVGTYGYRAPEQESLEGNKISTGQQKDVFALAMIWHEMLSGTEAARSYREFRQDPEELVWMKRLCLPAEVTASRDGARLEQLFEKMTERDPDKRPTLERVMQMLPAKPKRRNLWT